MAAAPRPGITHSSSAGGLIATAGWVIFRSRSGPPGHYTGEGLIIRVRPLLRERDMPTAPLRSALQAALSGTRHGLRRGTDAELLAAFAAVRDEAAFAELVRRHGRLVRG